MLICDDTHATNRFGLLYFDVIGVDRNNKSVVLAQALISHQDIPSYAWVFQFLKRELRGLEPKTIFSDGDRAIAAAIKEVFPNTKHNLCMWHFKSACLRDFGLNSLGKCVPTCDLRVHFLTLI